MTYNAVKLKTTRHKTTKQSKGVFLGIPNKIRLSKIKARDLIRNINSLTQTPLL